MNLLKINVPFVQSPCLKANFNKPSGNTNSKEDTFKSSSTMKVVDQGVKTYDRTRCTCQEWSAYESAKDHTIHDKEQAILR